MWTSQVYGHHDKMARTKTHRTSQNTEYTKTQQTFRNNYFLCFSDFSIFFIFNFQLLLHKMLNYRLGTVNELCLYMKFYVRNNGITIQKRQ